MRGRCIGGLLSIVCLMRGAEQTALAKVVWWRTIAEQAVCTETVLPAVLAQLVVQYAASSDITYLPYRGQRRVPRYHLRLIHTALVCTIRPAAQKPRQEQKRRKKKKSSLLAVCGATSNALSALALYMDTTPTVVPQATSIPDNSITLAAGLLPYDLGTALCALYAQGRAVLKNPEHAQKLTAREQSILSKFLTRYELSGTAFVQALQQEVPPLHTIAFSGVLPPIAPGEKIFAATF